jgi:hypothetical protein
MASTVARTGPKQDHNVAVIHRVLRQGLGTQRGKQFDGDALLISRLVRRPFCSTLKPGHFLFQLIDGLLEGSN